MQLLDLTLPTPEENLALDEALLDDAEAAGSPCETLRLWEPREPMVVVGRSSRVDVEVNLAAARERNIPVMRRCSGGAAIVTGPGCLMYAVVLSYENYPALHMLDEAHRLVLSRIQAGLCTLGLAVNLCGTSDLTIAARKFSGNSLRCKRTHLLYHGTLLCQSIELELISELLGVAPRQPAYRAGRGHAEFVTCLPTTVENARQAVIAGWPVVSQTTAWPQSTTAALVSSRYSQTAWNLGQS